VRQGNSAQVGPDLRGDGSTPWRFKIAQTLEAAMVTPMVASSPWMRRLDEEASETLAGKESRQAGQDRSVGSTGRSAASFS
jgi:hypothetical protein